MNKRIGFLCLVMVVATAGLAFAENPEKALEGIFQQRMEQLETQRKREAQQRQLEQLRTQTEMLRARRELLKEQRLLGGDLPQVVSIWQDASGGSALILDLEGRMYSVRPGDRLMGAEHLIVERIAEEGVWVQDKKRKQLRLPFGIPK